MKPVLFKIPQTGQSSIRVQEEQLPYFYDKLHYHPEWQLTLLLKGTGTYLIGDRIGRFQPGDLLLLGANLPHVLRCDEEYYQTEVGVHAITLFFHQHSFGTGFLDLPESRPLRALLDQASRGLAFSSDARSVRDRMQKLGSLSGLEQLLEALHILHDLSRQLAEPLSGLAYAEPRRDADTEKLNDVFDFMMRHYARAISLSEVASVAHLSDTAFCRYFKTRTGKTFSEFLNDIRVSHACRLLLRGKQNISEIAFQCGFNNLSNFNRRFKQITGLTPGHYLRRYKGLP